MPPPLTDSRPRLATVPSRSSRRGLVSAATRRRAARRGRPLVVTLVAAVVLAALGPAFRLSTASADGVPGLPDLTFYGRGYGHGVGMSQYGARGRALAGQLAPEILAHYYPKTTLGARSASTQVRVLLLTGFAATAAKPLAVVGLSGGWTIKGIAAVFPANARLTLVPTAPKATTWNLKVVSSAGSTLAAKVVSGDLWVQPVNGMTVLQLVSKATTTNVYRSYFRIRLTTTALVVNHIPLDTYLKGVVPTEMPASWPVEALKSQAIAARSYALSHVHPTTGLFDVYDDTRSQVYRGKRAETAATNLAISTTAGQVLLSGTSIVNALFHSADGGWTEDNENVFVSSTGSIVAGPVSYLRGSSDRAPDGTSYDRASPYATWKTATYTADALSAILAKDAADERRDPHRPRPEPARGVGPAHQRDPDRIARREDGLGRGLPGGLQRRAAGDRPAPPRHPVRHDPDSLTDGGRYRRPMIDLPFDPDVPRCGWSSAGADRPDPVMVRYHDEEWGTPCHDDVELFERLALESFQAGLSWSTILHKRPAFRSAFAGFDPVLVAAFDDADRARLMADAGIVRNRAKIDATIGNAAAWLATGREHGSVDAYLATMVPGPVARLAPDVGPGAIPARTEVSDALSTDLRRRGFKFVGSTIVYALMQSIGLVDDHLATCFRYRGGEPA